MSFVRWSEVRAKHMEAAGAEEVERGKERLLGQVRGYRLAEMRKRRGLTQRQVAQTLGVTVGRVSQIENGDVSGIDVLGRYVTALGGELRGRANQGRLSGVGWARRAAVSHWTTGCSDGNSGQPLSLASSWKYRSAYGSPPTSTRVTSDSR